jgi:glucokinase
MAKTKKQYSIGIDIGGTKMNAVLFDGKNIIADYLLATPRDSLDHFMVMLKALVEPLLEKASEDKVKIIGIGLGIAGVIDYKEEKMLESPNLGIINGVKIGEELQKIINLPIVIDNDGNCFVRAEATLGAAQKYQNVYGIIIGTGIGGGWWLNNNVYRAVHGGSGEPGEMIVEFESGMLLENAYHKLTQFNPANMAEEAYRGDVLAEKAYDEVGALLGTAFANIANLIAPELIVIGGGVVEASNLFLARAKRTMREHIASSEVKKKLKITKSKLGTHAGAIGAALLVRHKD